MALKTCCALDKPSTTITKPKQKHKKECFEIISSRFCLYFCFASLMTTNGKTQVVGTFYYLENNTSTAT